jgi:hypothetical protein
LNILRQRAGEVKQVPAAIHFQYESVRVSAYPERSMITIPEEKKIIYRDLDAERAGIDVVKQLGAKYQHSYIEDDPRWFLPVRELPALVRGLIERGWSVIAEGNPFRQSGAFNVSVSSGIDWFDVQVECDFGGATASLPDLLAAVRDKQSWVTLSDGTLGMLPEEWLEKYAGIVSLGEEKDGIIRFKKNQAVLLDAWLAAQPEAKIDELFTRTREKIAQFSQITAGGAPPGFKGALRPYQNEGIGWLEFLQNMEFGGCLADDMGLGKTVQVLAMLEERRAKRKKENLPPSLVVVPRSLMFNWIREAKKFTPKLRFLDHTGGDRELASGWEKKHDVILTT